MKLCPACSSAIYKKIKKIPQASVVLCKFCGLTFCELGFVEEDGDSHVIDTDPDFFHEIKEHFSIQVQVAREIIPRRLAEYERLLGRPVRSILEIGCATGAYASAYRELGIEYVGLELEASLAQLAKERTGADIRQGNFIDVDFSENFDVLFASQVLEHVTLPDKFLGKSKVIAKNGLVHIDVPNHNSLTATIRKIIPNKDYGFIQPPYHLIAYNYNSLSALAKKIGIEPVILCAMRNDDPVWGQLAGHPSLLNRIMFATSGFLNMGSLLTSRR